VSESLCLLADAGPLRQHPNARLLCRPYPDLMVVHRTDQPWVRPASEGLARRFREKKGPRGGRGPIDLLTRRRPRPGANRTQSP
jgi:hypothetical protein